MQAAVSATLQEDEFVKEFLASYEKVCLNYSTEIDGYKVTAQRHTAIVTNEHAACTIIVRP